MTGVVVASALLSLGFAFSGENKAQLQRWMFPATSSDTNGLGGGLAFTVEPDFCEKLMPQMEDRSFIWCRDLQASMLRAMETWAANHQDIDFINATDKCAAEAAVADCFASPPDGYDSRGNCSKLCTAAEIFILAEHLYDEDGEIETEPARVGLYTSVGLGEGNSVLVKGPRTTSGPSPLTSVAIQKATLTINRNQCFSIDRYFCPGMYEGLSRGYNPLVVFSILLMPLLAVAIVGIVVKVCMAACQMKEGHGMSRSWAYGTVAIIHGFSTPIWLTWLIITCFILAPYVQFVIVMTCMTCFDFEASMVHYVGEVLGLADPQMDALDYGNFAMRNFTDSLNRTKTRLIDGANCDSEAILPPTDGNALCVAAAYNETGLGTGSVMLTPSLGRAERCPTMDDLAGLNMLYPTCLFTNQNDPICMPGDLYGLSVTRMAAVVLTGTMITFFVLLFLSWTTAWCMRKLDELEETSPYVSKAQRKKQAEEEEYEREEYASVDEMSQRADALELDLDPSGARAPMHRI